MQFGSLKSAWILYFDFATNPVVRKQVDLDSTESQKSQFMCEAWNIVGYNKLHVLTARWLQ